MNEPKAQPTGGGMDVGTLQARLDRIRLEISRQQARLRRGSLITAIVGVVLCVLVAFYFGVGYKAACELLTPKALADYLEDRLLKGLPETRKNFERDILDSADEWAHELSQALQDHTPAARAWTEDFLIEQLEQDLKQRNMLTADQFRNFVRQNQPLLADGFRSMKEPERPRPFVADLQSAVETSMSGLVREQADELLHTPIDLTSKLKRIEKGVGLTYEEELLRDILMIAKRLQVEGEGGLPAKRKEPKSAQRAVAAETETPEEPPAKPTEPPEKAAKQTDPEKKSENN